MNRKFLTIVSLIVIATICRFLPHPPNFTPIGAIALFAGVFIANRYLAVALPLVALFISDMFLGLYGAGMIPVYFCTALVSVLGIAISGKKNPAFIIGSSILGAIVFFLVTNCVFLYTADNTFYPVSLDGLMQSYISALPFFKNSVQGDLFFTTVLFGAYYLLRVNVPFLKENKA